MFLGVSCRVFWRTGMWGVARDKIAQPDAGSHSHLQGQVSTRIRLDSRGETARALLRRCFTDATALLRERHTATTTVVVFVVHNCRVLSIRIPRSPHTNCGWRQCT